MSDARKLEEPEAKKEDSSSSVWAEVARDIGLGVVLGGLAPAALRAAQSHAEKAAEKPAEAPKQAASPSVLESAIFGAGAGAVAGGVEGVVLAGPVGAAAGMLAGAVEGAVIGAAVGAAANTDTGRGVIEGVKGAGRGLYDQIEKLDIRDMFLPIGMHPETRKVVGEAGGFCMDTIRSASKSLGTFANEHPYAAGVAAGVMFPVAGPAAFVLGRMFGSGK